MTLAWVHRVKLASSCTKDGSSDRLDLGAQISVSACGVKVVSVVKSDGSTAFVYQRRITECSLQGCVIEAKKIPAVGLYLRDWPT